MLVVVVGIAIGFVMGVSKVVRDYFDLVVSVFYVMLVIVFGLLFIFWFGIGMSLKVVVVFILVVLLIVINIESGICMVDLYIFEMANVFLVLCMQIFFKVMLFAVLLFVLIGIWFGVGCGLLGVVAGELFVL